MSRRILWYEDAGAPDEDDGPEELLSVGRRRKSPVDVLYEGPGFTVVAKPSGIASVPERHDQEAPNVMGAIATLWSKTHPERGGPVLVHRLDKGTSGCLAVAHDRPTARILMNAFRKRQVEKSYLALTLGAPQPPEGEVSIRVRADPKRPGAMERVRKGGKPCHSTYETVETFRGIAWVRVRPTTGRTHEVRLALAQLGTPCAIDPLYGTPEPILLSRWKRGYRAGRGQAERPLVDRLTLHAASLTLPDPTAPDDPERRITVEAPLPRDLSATLKQLRKHAAPGSL